MTSSEQSPEEQHIWEQRWHPLRREWVLYASHRGGRPWIGETKERDEEEVPAHDPTCALCPGNERLKGKNPRYTEPFCFTNDLPCFSPTDVHVTEGDDLYATKAALGTAEVLCYHPDHGKTFADLTAEEAKAVVALWKERFEALGAREDVEHVLIFENKGSAVGTSNPHPHCQIYAGNLIYGITDREVTSGREYHQRTGRLLGIDLAERELAGPRVICSNEHFMACVPWFARYAYEILIFPLQPAASLADLDEERQASLAEVMLEVSIRYDNLWKMPMPYVMAFHQAPSNGEDQSTYPFHIEYHPPLRNPTTLKYLAGPEVGGGSMTNETNPDAKAAELQAVSDRLYRTPRPCLS